MVSLTDKGSMNIEYDMHYRFFFDNKITELTSHLFKLPSKPWSIKDMCFHITYNGCFCYHNCYCHLTEMLTWPGDLHNWSIYLVEHPAVVCPPPGEAINEMVNKYIAQLHEYLLLISKSWCCTFICSNACHIANYRNIYFCKKGSKKLFLRGEQIASELPPC